MFAQIKKDIDSIMLRDPAAKTRLEAALCYPGLHAIWLHRIAHHFYLKGWVVFPRLINTFSRFLTGIDIHPGAKLGRVCLLTTVWAWLLAKPPSLAATLRSTRE